MPKPVTETTITFTYNIADELFSSSSSQNRTASATYTGPDRVWVCVNEETGDYDPQHGTLTLAEDADETPIPFGTRKVEVVASEDPIIIALFHPQNTETLDQSTVTETMPDGTEYSYNDKPTVDQTYELDDLIHNGTEWVLPAFKQSDMSWENIIHIRNNMLLASDGKISPDQPDSIKQPWIDFRQTLRDFPATYGYGTDSEIPAWKVLIPTAPGDE